MNSRDFCFWLQGFFEVSGQKDLNAHQVEIVRKHLDMVFAHEIDPSMGDKKHQDLLTLIHQGDTDSGHQTTNAPPWRPDRDPKIKC